MTTPTHIVIFGASGDLTRRMLIPALFHLFCKGRLSPETNIIGFAITGFSRDEFRAHLREGLKTYAPGAFHPGDWEAFAERLWYVQGDFSTPGDYTALDAQLCALEDEPRNRLYYFATAPRFFPVIADCLGVMNMDRVAGAECRVVVEKPFGRDLASAQALNRGLHDVFAEDQIFRIDHFLGKETAQNIMFFRFANTLFDLGWNRNYIDHVQISVTETVDVGQRGGYYDQAGILRDMFQNHLLQLLALTAMEPPTSFDADAIRTEKVKVLSALRPIKPEEVAAHTVRGQYRGYQRAAGVAPGSQTATYAALRVFVDNWRWQDVPFYLRSGKSLTAKETEIMVQFRRPAHMMFPLPAGRRITPNRLSLCLQPDEGIHFDFQAKVPDTIADMQTVAMNFHYDNRDIPDAYERLLLDALSGDASLFTRSDGIEAAWRFIDPIIAGWAGEAAPPLEVYEPGAWGPGGADELLAVDGRHWVRGCLHDD